MTIFGLAMSEVSARVSAVAGAADGDQTAEIFARAGWSGIAEPGDRVAGELIAALGPARALTVLIDRAPAESIAAEIADSGAAPNDVGVADVAKALDRWSPRLRSSSALLALAQAARLGVRLLTPGDPLWPASLADLGPHAPIALWVRGTEEALTALDRSISLVGARAATGYGEHVTMEASAGLVDRGFAIVSGAAYGIDGMAHRTALASRGVTVAFLAGGVDRFYPSGHDALLARMVECGAVISELPCGAQPSKWRFLQRNRLIAATGQATVVLEAGQRSGSLNTAGHAAALGRPLGAVPGPVTSPASAGCHRLIREFDAVCVTTAQQMADLVDGGAGAAPGSEGPENGSRSAAATRVLDALSPRSSRDTADLAARSGLAVAEVQAVLGELDLEGAVRERESGWVSTVSSR
ncbi:DNA-processing protein DprA [Homoserinimonas hongtaonis]|uniref:DNA-processing protein DprA n=1 Tax=Homoserinimonas hongtaonis TaxID=2079791 RepID=UPI000D37A7A5|nr:DNA-processing protein DprA [Salinibacterium hongtaonis]AWB89605.1 DNA-protecting protein DprA [Salinibacterium hongtaonis]